MTDERSIEAGAQRLRPLDGWPRRQGRRDEGLEAFAGSGDLEIAALRRTLHRQARNLN